MPEFEDSVDYRNHAGTVLWPATPGALTDTTKCPACFTPLVTTVCRTCGLDVAHPAAAELAAASNSASASLSLRIDLIGRIRYDTSRESVATITAPIPSVTETADEQTPTAALPATQLPAFAPPQASFSGPAPAAVRRPGRSSVQVALLIAAVSLLSVFAIFFLVYAFITYGIFWRSVIIAAITVAAFVAASLLRRRALVASAEGLAVFALVLVYLDAYALRANDFFSLGTLDQAVYWGVTLALASLGFIGWHRLSGVRAASIVGWATIAPGAGLLAWGLAAGAEPITRAWLALAVGAAVSGLAHLLVPRGAFAGAVERMLLLSTASVALVTASLVSWTVDPATDWGGAAALACVSVLALVLTAAATAGRTGTAATRAFGQVFAAIGGVAAASVAAAAAVRLLPGELDFTMVVPAVAAAATTLGLEAAAVRIVSPARRRATVAAAWASTAILALTTALPLYTAAEPVVRGLLDAVGSPWSASALTPVATVPHNGIAVLALAIVAALAGVLWAATGRLAGRSPALIGSGAAVLVLAAVQLPNLWLTLGGWLVLAAAAFLLLWRGTWSAESRNRAVLVGTLAAATGLMFAVAWTSLDTWGLSTGATVLVLVACRLLTDTAGARAALLGGALSLAFVGIAATAPALHRGTPLAADVEAIDSGALVALAGSGALMLCAADLTRATVSALDRRAAFWIAGVAAVVGASTAFTRMTAGGSGAGLLLPQFGTSLVTSILVFAGLLLWVGLRVNAPLRAERITASIALGPALFWVVDSFARVLGLNDFADSVVPVTTALLAAAGALAISLLRPVTSPRWARELGVALVGLPAVLTTITDRDPLGWLVLLLASVTVLLLAIDRDGLFSSHAARRHLGWAALALATAGLWWRLRSDQIDAVEPYVLPLGAALLTIAYFIHRAASKADAGGASKAAPLVALAGLLVAILPLAANAVTGELARAIIVAAAAAAMLLGGSLVGVGGRFQRYLDVAALAGGIALIVTAAGRALQAPAGGLALDSWVAALFLLLVTAGLGQADRLRRDADRWRGVAGQVLGLIGIGAVLIECTGFAEPALGTVRALACVTLLSALQVVSSLLDRAPFSHLIGLAAISAAAGSAVVGLATDALDPLELATVPIAIALLTSGTLRLAADPSLRSWRPLGVGIGVLLVPSLLATTDSPDLWRLVGLGIASVTVLITGAVRRLQAPFILGLAVALVHGFATFAPQIRAVYESQEWWFWAGIAGVLLLVLAVRYEQRIQNLKGVVLKISSLR